MTLAQCFFDRIPEVEMEMASKLLTTTFVSALLTSAVSVTAAPLVLPGAEPIYFQYNNLEQVNTSNTLNISSFYAPATGTQGNWGLVNVSSIQHGFPSVPHQDIAGGPVFFADDGPGGTAGQITGIFYGIQISADPTRATGGTLDLFWHDPGTDTITQACLAGSTCLPNAAAVGQFTSGTFLVRLNFASGIINGNNVVTIQSTTNPTIGLSGQADSFANVNTAAPGPWTTVLNGDWFFVDPNGNGVFGEAGETRDVRFSNFYNNLDSWSVAANGTQGLRSNDPARVFTVPEPDTVALLGLIMFVLGWTGRRSRKQE